MEKLHVGQLALIWLVGGLIVWVCASVVDAYNSPLLGLTTLPIIISVAVSVLVITWRWFGARASRNGH